MGSSDCAVAVGACECICGQYPICGDDDPVIRSLAQAGGMDLSVLAWALSMGTDIGGCGTPIGASANVVGISVAAKNGHFIGWGKYCRYAAPATVLVILISMVCIYVRYF